MVRYRSRFYIFTIFLSIDLTLDQTESKRYPRCSRSHILHNHTLKGGLRAGNFSVISQVDSIENCAAICCNEENCNLALMLDEVCYIGDCANTDLCVPVPVFEGSSRTSQIAFISNPRKASDNDLIKGKLRHACHFCLISPTRVVLRLVSYSRFQAAVQIAFLILVRTYVMLFCNYSTSNKFALWNLQLCPQTSKLGSKLRSILHLELEYTCYSAARRTLHFVAKCKISYYVNQSINLFKVQSIGSDC